MKHAFISQHIALTCSALALLNASIALAQDSAFSMLEDSADTQLISSEAAAESSGADKPGNEQQQPIELNQRQSDIELLLRNFESYKSALTFGNYSEADTLAKRVVESSIKLYGLDSHESAKALSNLGLVQQKNKDYETAVMNFTAAIDIVERIEDRLNRELMRPLRGLGAAQLASGHADLARASFDRAMHISHVNDGPLNVLQIGILEDLAEIHLTSGNVDKAADLHEFIYNLEARNTDLNSEDIIPALERQAEWLHRLNSFEKERVAWRKIIRILEKSRGKKDLSLIGPLTGLGTSYLYQSDYQSENYTDGTMTSGDTYLKRAARIADQHADATWMTRLQTRLALADFYTLSLRARKAGRAYKETWDFLSTDEAQLETRNSLFDQPKLLQPIYPAKYFNSERKEGPAGPPDNFELGTIILSYTISDRGFSKNIKIVEANPAGLKQMEYSVAREARRLIYRPRLEDGIAVETLNQSYVHEFYYRPSDVPVPENAELAQSDDLPPAPGEAASAAQIADRTLPNDDETDPKQVADRTLANNDEADLKQVVDRTLPNDDEADPKQVTDRLQPLTQDDQDNNQPDAATIPEGF